jgi:hypothetical protein
VTKSPAWVSGHWTVGYRLNVESLPETADFVQFTDSWFTTFRSAQVIANAIKARVKILRQADKRRAKVTS